MGSPFVQRAVELFSFFEKGILPNKNLENTTHVYRATMGLLTRFKDEAQVWFEKEREKRKHKQKN